MESSWPFADDSRFQAPGPKQLPLPLPKREGTAWSGRPRTRPHPGLIGPGVPHLKRTEFPARHPVHTSRSACSPGLAVCGPSRDATQHVGSAARAGGVAAPSRVDSGKAAIATVGDRRIPSCRTRPPPLLTRGLRRPRRRRLNASRSATAPC